jgi:diaminopimelate dehydrogenase
MGEQIRIGIIGYGNLGRGVELAIAQNKDMILKGVFTRRSPDSIVLQTEGVKAYPIDRLEQMTNDLDVVIICGGSATDLPEQSPRYASLYNVVDSFDTHAKIPEHFEKVDKAAKNAGKVALISGGWDPGLFSINRLYGNCILPCGEDYTFWGKGVSQGHSDAIRRIEGVLNAKQYTIPVEEAIESVRSGNAPKLSTREKHKRECFVVAKEGADKKEIERQIVTMPNYFADYDTTVHFIDLETFEKEHGGMAHGGFVIRSGRTGKNEQTNHVIEYSLRLGSNPEFTASVLVAYARAVYKMANEGQSGCKTVFDVPPAYLSPKSAEQLRKDLL